MRRTKEQAEGFISEQEGACEGRPFRVVDSEIGEDEDSGAVGPDENVDGAQGLHI